MERPCKEFLVAILSWLCVISVGGSLQLRAAPPDDATLKAAGIRKLASEHLTLYTDLPTQPDVDELPKVFEAAIPHWAKFFDVDVKTFDGWNVIACVIQNRERFQEYGLLPRDLPPFLHGFQMFDKLWIYEQPSPYYRRHLLLHEGTHAAMNRIFGRVGPTWYREGIAEMLGTHQWKEGKLALPYFPADRKLVEYWGRIKIVNDDIAADSVRSIPSIVTAHTREFLDVESYAWSWALQSFGHEHPKFAPLFRSLQDEMYRSTRGVTRKFMLEYEKQKYEIDTAWRLFVSHLDYGYDSSFETIDTTPSVKKLAAEKIESFQIDSAKAWQSTGLSLPPDSTIDIVADGRYRIALEQPSNAGTKNELVAPVGSPGKEWICEPQGVTIEYYQGRPLGQLIAAVQNPDDPTDTSGLTRIQAVGRRGRIRSEKGGVLYMRVNERSDRLRDNRGKITVKLRFAP